MAAISATPHHGCDGNWELIMQTQWEKKNGLISFKENTLVFSSFSPFCLENIVDCWSPGAYLKMKHRGPLMDTGHLWKSIIRQKILPEPSTLVKREACSGEPALDRGLCFECLTRRSMRGVAGAVHSDTRAERVAEQPDWYAVSFWSKSKPRVVLIEMLRKGGNALINR